MRALRRSRGEPAVQTMPEAGGASWLPNRPPPIFHHLESRACHGAFLALHRSHCAGAEEDTAKKFTNKPNYQRRSGRTAAPTPGGELYSKYTYYNSYYEEPSNDS